MSIRFPRPSSELLRAFSTARLHPRNKGDIIQAVEKIMSLSAHERGRITKARPLVFQIYRKAAA